MLTVYGQPPQQNRDGSVAKDEENCLCWLWGQCNLVGPQEPLWRAGGTQQSDKRQEAGWGTQGITVPGPSLSESAKKRRQLASEERFSDLRTSKDNVADRRRPKRSQVLQPRMSSAEPKRACRRVELRKGKIKMCRESLATANSLADGERSHQPGEDGPVGC